MGVSHMQIINQPSAKPIQKTNQPLELKQGEIYRAQIKERVSNTDAILQIRGKEVVTKFEGSIPAEDRVTVQITGHKDQTAVVKTINVDVPKADSTPQSSEAKVLQSVGISAKDIPELKQGVQVLLDKGLPVTKEAVQELKAFFEKTQGTAAAKLDTIKALANKRLEVTQSTLRSIHEALHGRPLNEVLTDLAKELDRDFDLEKNRQKEIAQRSAQRNTNREYVEKVKADIIKNQKNIELEALLQNSGGKSNIRPSEVIQNALKQIQKEPNLERALNEVKKDIQSHSNIDSKTTEKVEAAIVKSQELLEKGREIASRQQITAVLTELVQQISNKEPKINSEQKLTLPESLKYELNEQLQALPIESRNILITKVTQKLAQITADFREMKREITRNLDQIERLVNTFKNNSYPQAKPMLEATINKLDNAILKSEMMLFTDMKTEKKLMQASSQLAEAKTLLSKGDPLQAAKIVQDVKTLIDKINFKPSDQKIMHFVSKENETTEIQNPQRQLLNRFDDIARTGIRQEPSARQMFEFVKSLGLNYESDMAKSFVFQRDGQSSQEQSQQQQNLKSILMKLAQTGGEEATAKITQSVEQALNNVTGQQLLSKSDASGSLQTMFFSLPLLLGSKPENLRIFINSKKEDQQVDWENCSIYFLLETKKLGGVGIMLTTTDRNLSITIKNDKPGFKEKMEPIAAFTKEKLQEIGYNVNTIQFTRMTPTNSESTSEDKRPAKRTNLPIRPVFTEKGMDYKI